MNKKTIKIAGWALGLSMAVAGIGLAVGASQKAPMEAKAETTTYQHVFNAKPTVGNNTTLSTVDWNITATNLGSYNSGNYAGVQFGTSKANGAITLTSSYAWGSQENIAYSNMTKITEVRVWFNLGGTSVTPTVTIGGKAATSDETTVVKNSSAGTDWTKATKVTFTPASDGFAGVVTIAATSVKAGYICAMEIDCEQTSTDPEITFDDSSVNLKTNNSLGVSKSVTALNVTNIAYLWSTNDTNIILENDDNSVVTIKPNTDAAGSATVNLLIVGDNIDDYEASFTVTLIEPASYEITVTANNCTYTGASSIIEGEEATITFAADDGYNLPGSVTSISGATVKSFSNGVLTLQNPTDDVAITMTAVVFDNDYSIVSGGSYKISHTKSSTKYFLKATLDDKGAVSQGSAPTPTTNSWEAAIFSFTLIGDNQFQITSVIDSTTYYLYSIASNNGIRFSTATDAKNDYWTISDPADGKTGDYSLKSNNGNRYLSLYNTQDFRGYTSNTADNRTENTDLDLYDEVGYASDVLAATKPVCDVGYNNSKSSFSDIWEALKSDFFALASSDQQAFVSATYSLENDTVTATGETKQKVAEASARYDYLVAKYGLENYADRDISLELGAAAMNYLFKNNENENAPAIISIVGISGILAAGGYFFLRRKKEN